MAFIETNLSVLGRDRADLQHAESYLHDWCIRSDRITVVSFPNPVGRAVDSKRGPWTEIGRQAKQRDVYRAELVVHPAAATFGIM